MRSRIALLLGIILIPFLVWTAIFSWKNLRGIRPALGIGSARVTAMPGQTEAGANITGLPLIFPQGFSLSVFARDLRGPRVMLQAPEDTLLVSIPSQGRVVALPDRDRNGTADRTVTVLDGLRRPHGLALRCDKGCRLYVAEETGVSAYVYDPVLMTAASPVRLAALPGDGGHVTRTLLLTNEQPRRLLISVGSSCNVCEEEDWRRAKILAMPAEGGPMTVFASGLRNSVFMTLNPTRGEIWATEMGRDLLGDDIPPDEINIIQQGSHYGWPYCYGANVHDDRFDPRSRRACRAPHTIPAKINVPAHSAPLGLAFFPDKGWPQEYRGDLLVAFHGSWNRSVPTGYKVVRYRRDPSGAFGSAEDFLTGWLTENGAAIGRPVDILIRADGTILISDDRAGVIYRMSLDLSSQN